MQVPLVDLARQHAPLRKALVGRLCDIIDSSSFVLGPYVASFERRFAEYCGAAHCVAVNSGTSALHLTLLALGIGAGDEVITVANTFAATTEAILMTGAQPVFVDVDPVSLTMDVAAAQRAISERTRAILPVHLYGRSANLSALDALCRQHRLWLVEDACQAHGARHQNRRVGAWGIAGCFSFYPAKNLGACGEAGAIVTGDAEVAAALRRLRDHGSEEKYWHLQPGCNARMDAFQGAVLDLKLHFLDVWNQQRRAIARYYNAQLPADRLRLPLASWEMGDADDHVYHLYVVRVRERDRVRASLGEVGVETGLHYPTPLHLQPAFAAFGRGRGSLPVTEEAAEQLLSLPLFPGMSAEEVEWVVRCVKESVPAVAFQAA